MATPPLVLLHAIGLDGTMWQFCPDLPDVQPITLPGHGSEPALDEVTLATVADHVAEALGPSSTVVGCSLGGAVAQHLALRHPDLVQSLVLVATKPVYDRGEMLRRAWVTTRVGSAGQVDETLVRWFTADAFAVRDHPGVAYARSALLRGVSRQLSAYWCAMSDHDVRQTLHRVIQPTTIVIGSGDVTMSVDAARQFADLFPRGRMEICPGPHLLPLEDPEHVSKAIASHLTWVQRQ